ncbi:MAG: rod shape-determining protein RodA [candidate division WOR-3 bacterium]|nr:MAG: rod shape-determining protein RodA [candidate division WOR-3 bacterium]
MFKKIDHKILAPVIILSIVGLLMIFSTAGLSYALRQGIWFIVALSLALTFSKVSPRIWYNISPFIYAVTIILLFVILFSHGVYPKRWFRLGWFSFQPSEFAKLATILILANFLARRKKMESFADMFIPLLIATIPAALIFVEPDLGAAQIFFPILIVMLYWGGMPGAKIFIFFSPIISAAASFSIYIWVFYIIALTVFLYFHRQLGDFVYGLVSNSLAGLTMPIVWHSLKAYQQKRIISFFSPWVDPQGMSWQIIQSKIAIGSGRLFGKGFLSGTQKKLEFLPERHTDFIFSCLGEEFGLIGITLTLLIIVYLLYRIIVLVKETKNRFSSICACGICAWLGYQTFLNIGMTIGLLPITGVPLPFISYGGSSLLASFMAIGVCLAITKSKLEYS